MLLGLSAFDPLGGIGQDIVGWFGHAISQGIGEFASWALGGVIHAMAATTTPDFTSWFNGPWRATLTVVAWLSVPILFIGVGTAALRGDLTSVLKRGLGAPVVMATGTAVAIPVTAGLLTLVNACCGLLVNVALGGNQGFGQGLGHLSDFALSATVTTGGSSLPGLAAVLIVALAGLAALVIWFVLALRGALLYLEVLAIPLALCGLYWGGTAHWVKRLVDLIIATVLSQLVITMLMVLAAADLNSGQLSGSGTGAIGGDMTTLFLCLAFLILGSLALPMALKHVPAATEHATTAASQISGPGRMTYMGSRVAGTAKMMGGGGASRALVEAGAAAGPVGLAATGVAAGGAGAAAGAATTGARADSEANEDPGPSTTRSQQGTAAASSSSTGSPSSGGPTAGPMADRVAGGATTGGPAPASRAAQSQGGRPGQPARGQPRSPDRPGPSTPAGPGAPSAHEPVQGAVKGAARRAGQGAGSSTPTGGSHG